MKIKPGMLLVLGGVLLLVGVVLITLRTPVLTPLLQKAMGMESYEGKGKVRVNRDGTYHSKTVGVIDLWQGVIVVVGGASFIGGLAIIGNLAIKHKLNAIRNDRGSMNR